jgi:3-oxoadipate enol-lactonase
MAIKNGFAEVNDTRLYYEIAGAGEPLVFLHGNTLDTRMWDDQFTEFAKQYRVLRYDLRGFGKSAMPTSEPYSHAEDLNALMQYMEIEQAHVLGLSMGGGQAINFALTYPKATKTLILVDTSLAGFRFDEAFSSDFSKIAQIAKSEDLQAAKDYWLGIDLFAATRQLPDVSKQLEAIINDYSGWHWLNYDPRREPEPLPIYQLDKILAPTLVIVGEKDIPDVHKIAAILEQQVSDVRKVVMGGAGHMPNMEQPEKFNNIVLNFLAENKLQSR